MTERQQRLLGDAQMRLKAIQVFLSNVEQGDMDPMSQLLAVKNALHESYCATSSLQGLEQSLQGLDSRVG